MTAITFCNFRSPNCFIPSPHRAMSRERRDNRLQHSMLNVPGQSTGPDSSEHVHVIKCEVGYKGKLERNNGILEAHGAVKKNSKFYLVSKVESSRTVGASWNDSCVYL